MSELKKFLLLLFLSELCECFRQRGGVITHNKIAPQNSALNLTQILFDSLGPNAKAEEAKFINERTAELVDSIAHTFLFLSLTFTFLHLITSLTKKVHSRSSDDIDVLSIDNTNRASPIEYFLNQNNSDLVIVDLNSDRSVATNADEVEVTEIEPIASNRPKIVSDIFRKFCLFTFPVLAALKLVKIGLLPFFASKIGETESLLFGENYIKQFSQGQDDLKLEKVPKDIQNSQWVARSIDGEPSKAKIYNSGENEDAE